MHQNDENITKCACNTRVYVPTALYPAVVKAVPYPITITPISILAFISPHNSCVAANIWSVEKIELKFIL